MESLRVAPAARDDVNNKKADPNRPYWIPRFDVSNLEWRSSGWRWEFENPIVAHFTLIIPGVAVLPNCSVQRRSADGAWRILPPATVKRSARDGVWINSHFADAILAEIRQRSAADISRLEPMIKCRTAVVADDAKA